MRRTLIIIGAIALILIGAGAFVYFYFATGTPGVAVAPDGTTSLPLAGQVPSSGTAGSGDTGSPTIVSPSSPVTVTSRLTEISAGPVVPGAAVTDSKQGSASSSPIAIVNYIERQSGNIFTYRSDTHTITRISNKTLPGIQSAAWLPDGTTAFVRYLSGGALTSINTYALSATTTGGFFLPQDLADVAVSSTSVLTLASGVNGSVGSTLRVDGTKSTSLFTSPLTSLRVGFAGKNQYLAFTKPSSTLDGYAFLIGATGHFSRIAGPQSGLVALASPSGKSILVSYVQSGSMHMELINAATGAALTLPVATIADKCVWATDDSSIYCAIPISPASASYPDDWYQGAVQFTDRIWSIHVSDRYAQLVLDFSQAKKGSLDAVGLSIDPLRSTLVFTNKNDGSLWSYSL